MVPPLAAIIFGSIAFVIHEHAAHVQIEAEIPILDRAIENCALVNVPGAVEQNVDCTDVLHDILNCCIVENVEIRPL